MKNRITIKNGRSLSKCWKPALQTTALCLLALASAPVAATAGQRLLTDFTSRQAKWCLVFNEAEGSIDCEASYYGGPDCLNGGFFLTGPNFWTDPKTGLVAFVDVWGVFDPGSFGTTVDGSVTESRRPDGRAEVMVVVHTSHALTGALDSNFERLFGHSFFEVQQGAEPTLGESLIQVAFKNTRPGAPLPDLFQLLFCPEPGQELEVISIRAQASGPLREAFGVPEGTPGRLEVTQTGLIGVSSLVNPHSRVALDAFPAEKVIIRRTGK